VPKTLGAEPNKRANVDFAGQWDTVHSVQYGSVHAVYPATRTSIDYSVLVGVWLGDSGDTFILLAAAHIDGAHILPPQYEAKQSTHSIEIVFEMMGIVCNLACASDRLCANKSLKDHVNDAGKIVQPNSFQPRVLQSLQPGS
jgi:hypothetical protein